MGFDFIQGLDCDPLELDRRLKQAEDNPPGPGPVPPGPTPGVDFDYSTTPVLTTALPHWGADFQGIEENSMVLKDYGVFLNLGIAYTKKLKLFVRAWAPRSAYGNRGGSGFSGVAMLYLGDDSCNFSNNGTLPSISDKKATGSITIQNYYDIADVCSKDSNDSDTFYKISITTCLNTGAPLQNAKTSIATYTLSGSINSSNTFSFTVTGKMTQNNGQYSNDSECWTALDQFNTQKTLEFCDGFFAWIGHMNSFKASNSSGQTLVIPFGYAFQSIFTSAPSITNSALVPLEPIFDKDKELHQQDPTIWHPEGVGVPLNNFTKYNAYGRTAIHPRARVAAGQRFKPGYVAENLPAEWNTM